MKNDLRIIILKEINSFGHSTEQECANEFLSKIKTYNGKQDFYTIVEALKELRADGLIKESREYHIIESISSSEDQNKNLSWSNPKRFIEKVDDYAPKIDKLYLFCTLKGKQFLIENDKLMIDYTLSKWNKVWFWVIGCTSVVGLILSILAFLKTP